MRGEQRAYFKFLGVEKNSLIVSTCLIFAQGDYQHRGRHALHHDGDCSVMEADQMEFEVIHRASLLADGDVCCCCVLWLSSYFQDGTAS